MTRDHAAVGGPRPRRFIGSSSEGRDVADRLTDKLYEHVEVRPWHAGVFGVGDYTLDRLLEESREVDFAALCLTPDDLVDKRGARGHAPRDNVIFEAGLFMGRLGRERTFLVHRRDAELQLPSDLHGLTAATYPEGDLQVTIGIAATRLKDKIAEFAPRELWRLGADADLEDLQPEFLADAAGEVGLQQADGTPVLVLERRNVDGWVNLWITSYRDRGNRRPTIRPALPELGRLVLSVELDARTTTPCTLLAQLKADGAAGGQYAGERRWRLEGDGWTRLTGSFDIRTTAALRARLQQRSVDSAPSRLELRGLRLVETRHRV
jgi:hypothetical protein